VATYGYRCDEHGPVELAVPIGTAPATTSCPTCGETAAREYTAPRLAFGDRGRMAVIDRAEASRTEPAVVTGLPAGRGGRSPRASDPRLRGLPRP
jgi:putative FmdB family regulatory protein